MPGQSELGWVSDLCVKWLTEGYNCRESVFPSPSPSLLGGACLKFQGEGGEDGALAESPWLLCWSPLKATVPVLCTVCHWFQSVTEASITCGHAFLKTLWCLEEVLFVTLDDKIFQKFLVLSIGFLISVPEDLRETHLTLMQDFLSSELFLGRFFWRGHQGFCKFCLRWKKEVA